MSNPALEPGSRGNPLKFKLQDYESLRSACLKEKKLFEDPEFAADQGSIGKLPALKPDQNIVWLRPKEINKQAQFIVGKTDTTDICQGQLGDCWLLAALSCLTLQPTLISYVVPEDQSFQKSYAGLFRFRFWQYGCWEEVLVDDRLPTLNRKLLFTHSLSQNEFWSALLEKAYAKLCGCYASLKGGSISEAMEDFTGGIAETIKVSKVSALWGQINQALSRGTLLSCFIETQSKSEVGQQTPNGLVKGHAYSITGTGTVKAGSVSLLRLRNPWGFLEYSGPWSDESPEWQTVDSKEKELLDLQPRQDGEFWMCIDDFKSLYSTVEMCSVSPDSLEDSQSDWGISTHQGSWVAGCSSGGNPSFTKSYWCNPQFRVRLEEDDDIADGKLLCSAVLELLQKHRRKGGSVDFLPIAFDIYQVPPEFQNAVGSLDRGFFSKRPPVAQSCRYSCLRAVREGVRLPPGDYVIVASTNSPGQEGSFYLRVYAKKGNESRRQGDHLCSSTYSKVMADPTPPDTKSTVEKHFHQHASMDNRLNSLEFSKLVNSALALKPPLTLQTCHSLIFAEDTQNHGTLTLPQTKRLVTALRKLQSVFSQFDQDSSGTMSSFELRLALKKSGFQLDSRTMQLLWLRHRTDDLCVTFDDFVNIVAKLRKLFDLFESEAKINTKVKQQGINTWLLKFIGI
ncbi:calpain-9-like [Acipenser ruthenus]|uniref:calpain-9-like n=1 Tax=Acipenser ruthenus TaxID=7906 RepID=UPI00145BDCF7|nr:calpain-9-like [Acipenser ruthenus]